MMIFLNSSANASCDDLITNFLKFRETSGFRNQILPIFTFNYFNYFHIYNLLKNENCKNIDFLI